MNKAKLKSYAPAARRDFIQAVTDRANFYGLSETETIPIEVNGDVALIGGRPFPGVVAAQRKKLEERVNREGFKQVMEAVAYTWFNRFLALRYMELHDYLEHGFRVLSNSGSSNIPEILDHASELDLSGLNKQKVLELKLDGSKDAELYRLLLVAQCNALNNSMPFLFEKIADETELLLPDNLLHSDSLIRKLVTEIEEEDWQEVEIIGWLYQFYISEKKDQVIGKVVKSEDIPAATQLFTPNWIVKYMVQNSLGRQWIATYPDSPLKAKMEYYIEPAEQTDEVKAQLVAITPETLNPEKLTLLDPASGSGHILVEAYNVFKEIYLERGYSNRDFPRLILEKNIFGLDIDDRAAQMAGFALLMKARKDDRRILRSDNPVKLNVMAIQESVTIQINDADWGEQSGAFRELVELFKYGKTYGSLIQVSAQLTAKLPEIENALKLPELHIFQTASELKMLVEQAKVLASEYDCVVANPPYMGNKYLTPLLKTFLKDNFNGFEKDMFSAFMIRDISLTKKSGQLGFMSPFVWMFISSYENLRHHFIDFATITTLVQLEYSGFDGATVPICTFTIGKAYINNFTSSFVRLTNFRGAELQAPKALEAIHNHYCGWFYTARPDDFKKIPGTPIAYWVSENFLNTFKNHKSIQDFASLRAGMSTGDNPTFQRHWYEVNIDRIQFDCTTVSDVRAESRWFPCNSGGQFQKWYGNNEIVVDWENNGKRIKSHNSSAVRNVSYYFKDGLTYSKISSGRFAARYKSTGFLFDDTGRSIFVDDSNNLLLLLALLCSEVAHHYLTVLTPSLSFTSAEIGCIPFLEDVSNTISINAKIAVTKTKENWDSFETSWDFQSFPWLITPLYSDNIETAWQNWQFHCSSQIAILQKIESENNCLFIESYGLTNELTSEVSEHQITLARADREADMKRLLSYSIGCMMGRYSLDQPGLIYANSGNIDFDHSKYQTFPADDDGIVPVMDMEWFPDDAASRFEEFLKVAWPSPQPSPRTGEGALLEENLKFVADSLSPKGGETPRETIRRYVSTQFYKDHLQTYKKRPIYWLFSSGKQRAFECLVYLHRYNEATLSRMRNEYVTPLQGKFSAQAEYLSTEVNAAASTAERNRLQKQLDTLRKKQVELASYDELLRHYADQRINLDLDDGVKVNYGKFGALLAEVKAVTGGTE